MKLEYEMMVDFWSVKITEFVVEAVRMVERKKTELVTMVAAITATEKPGEEEYRCIVFSQGIDNGGKVATLPCKHPLRACRFWVTGERWRC